MTTELYRVESTSVAVSRGIGSEWARDHVHALGCSAQRNPLGAALIHLDTHRNPHNLMLVINLLAVELVRLRLCLDSESVDYSRDAIEWWLTQNCLNCHGTGVLNIEQHQCKVCNGTGKQSKPVALTRFIAPIDSAIEWLEMQQRHRLGNDVGYTAPATRTYRGPMDDAPEQGWATESCGGAE